MRLSLLFLETLRDDPADARQPSHRLLIRAGYVRELGAGTHALLPLGIRVRRRVEQVIREELDRIGGQEVAMPVVQPAGAGQAGGRPEAGAPEPEPEPVRFRDRAGREMVLATSHEAPVVELIRGVVRSWRQLPVVLYQLQPAFRDDPRAHGGFLRVRESVVQDSYSCDRDDAGLERAWQRHIEAYRRIFERLGLRVIPAGADAGSTEGGEALEFLALGPHGDDVVVLCEACGHAADRRVARAGRPRVPPEEPLPVEEVPTPHAATIADLARLLGVGEDRTAKATFFVTGEGRLVTAIVRGDFEVSEAKLASAAGSTGGLRPAHAEEIRAAGMEPGYASPIGAHGTLVVVDELVARSANLVAGANREGYHLRNVNVGRDFVPDLVAEIAEVRAGDPCPRCGAPVTLRTGTVIATMVRLATGRAEVPGATYLGEDGERRPVVMAAYRAWLLRAVAAVVEEHHDAKGITWPREVAPFHAHLVAIGASRDPRVSETCERLHDAALRGGREVLYDDRDESPGVKFADAELLGMPTILTVSPRSLAQDAVEVTDRATGERTLVPLAEVEAGLAGG